MFFRIPFRRGTSGTFHGGLSTQKILPFGTTEEVKASCERLLSTEEAGGNIFAPSHDVEEDVPIENMLVFIEKARNQQGYKD
jgi:uroporphyrinogen decarboxylase